MTSGVSTLAVVRGHGAFAPEVSADPRHPEVRLARLFDAHTLEMLAGGDRAGVVAARGRINAMPAYAYCTDATRMGGALGAEGCARIVSAIDAAVQAHAPIIGLWHSGGARLAEGVAALDGVGRVFAAIVRASGRVPQISVVLGPSAGGAAYGPALTDVVIMAPAGRVFVTGPDVVRSVTGQEVDMEQLGGPDPHSRRSGVAHLVAGSEADAVAQARETAVLLGQRRRSVGPRLEDSGSELSDPRRFLPDAPNRAYDIRPLVHALLDAPGLELHPRWAPNVVTTLGRIGGRTVGVVANNPIRRAAASTRCPLRRPPGSCEPVTHSACRCS